MTRTHRPFRLTVCPLEERAVPATLAPPVELGRAAVAGAADAVRRGDFVYVSGTNGISVFDISGANLNSPRLVRTVGQQTVQLEVRDDLLVAVRGGNQSVSNTFRLETYSLADPANPRLLGSTPGIPYSDGNTALSLTATHAFVVIVNLFLAAGNDIFDQTGGVVAVNISNPAAPFLDGDAVTAQGTPAGRDGVNDGVLFNANGTTTDGVKLTSGFDQSGGNSNTWAVAQISPTILYVTGSTSTGAATQTGAGVVHVVDVSDPRNMRVLRTVTIPGTVHAFGIAAADGLALITASEGGYNTRTADVRFTGNAVLATLDTTDPANPRLTNTRRTDTPALGIGQAVALGGGRFAYANQGRNPTDPGLFVVDATDPALPPTGLDIPAALSGLAGGTGQVFTADGSNLIVYRETPPAANTPPTVSDVPNQTSAGGAVGPVGFTVGDTETPAAALTLTATSSNPALVPAGNVAFGGSGASRTVTVTPAAGQTGTATITLRVTDAGGLTATDTFVVTVPAVPPPPSSSPLLVGYREIAAGGGAGGTARLLNPDRTERFALQPFAGFTGSVRTAAADLTGDGVADLIVGTGPGAATGVRVFDGVSRTLLFDFAPFEAAFVGGVYVAAGDISGDGVPDLLITPDEGGGPRVRVLDGKAAAAGGTTLVADYFGIEDAAFRGGARAAAADVTGDGRAEVVVSAGFLGGPRITVWDGASVAGGQPRPVANFFAFEDTLRNGAFVAAGDFTGDGFADLAFGGGPGGGPRVRVFDGPAVLAGGFGTLDQIADRAQRANFFAGDDAGRGGVRLAVKDVDRSGRAGLLAGAGPGGGTVTAYPGGQPPAAFDFAAFPSADGVFVG